jgi:hypothetical protein
MPEQNSRVNGGETRDGGQQSPEVADEELYTGTKIDSQEEDLALEGPLEPAEARAQGEVYTLGLWRVTPGQEAEFIGAWQALAEIFRQLPQPPAGKGVLVQSVTEPTLFYSFGPWHSLADIEAMRNDAKAQAGLEELRQLCDTVQPGAYRLVAEADI